MPKLVLASHVILLFAVSILVGGAMAVIVGDVTSVDQRLLDVASVVAWVTAGILVVTEWFSGVRWPPVFAVVALIAGAVLSDGGSPGPASAVAWIVAWVSVASWFAILAARSRENR